MKIIKEWIEEGRIVPVIDKVFPFEEAPQALKYLEGGSAKGKVVVKIKESRFVAPDAE